MKGTVFNIQKFSINDGPGIRTTVFFKGCPLHCIWCHNPESKSAKTEMFFDAEKCTLCHRCEKACPKKLHTFDGEAHSYDRQSCIACGLCADSCYTGALETVGKEMSADEIIAEVLKDKVFYETSGGGVTLSGGEPMLQFEFTYELLKLAKENGLHTCMETCGFAKPEQYAAISPLVDIFLYDYKESDPDRHKEFTGVSNELILENLKMLDNLGAKTVLRCPIIPELNDRDEHFAAIAALANSLENVMEINVEPYHPLGKSKSALLGKKYALPKLEFVTEAQGLDWINKIQTKTRVNVKKA